MATRKKEAKPKSGTRAFWEKGPLAPGYFRSHRGRTKVPANITASWLRRVGACRDAAKEFGSIFPQGVDFTPAALRQAVVMIHQSRQKPGLRSFSVAPSWLFSQMLPQGPRSAVYRTVAILGPLMRHDFNTPNEDQPLEPTRHSSSRLREDNAWLAMVILYHKLA